MFQEYITTHAVARGSGHVRRFAFCFRSLVHSIRSVSVAYFAQILTFLRVTPADLRPIAFETLITVGCALEYYLRRTLTVLPDPAHLSSSLNPNLHRSLGLDIAECCPYCGVGGVLVFHSRKDVIVGTGMLPLEKTMHSHKNHVCADIAKRSTLET